MQSAFLSQADCGNLFSIATGTDDAKQMQNQSRDNEKRIASDNEHQPNEPIKNLAFINLT